MWTHGCDFQPTEEGVQGTAHGRDRGTALRGAAPLREPDRRVEGAGSAAHRHPSRWRQRAGGGARAGVLRHRTGVTGLDISRTFVDIASENARQAGVSVDFRRGDAASMLLADESFDLIVCQAAFKNFAQPARALEEMYRVLRAGGMAIIQDMSRDASNA